MPDSMAIGEVDVVGMGIVSCLGTGVDTVFGAMCSGACGVRPIDRFPAEDFAQRSGGQLPAGDEDELREEFENDDLAAAMVKAAGREALQQAGLGPGAGDPGLGLVLATNFGPLESLEWCWRERLEVGTLDLETYRRVDQFLPTVAEWLGCAGPRVQLSLSCASGASAIALAKDWIRAGRASRVVAVGYDALTEYCWCGLSNLRTITTDVVRPFDIRRAGTVFSEGAACMVLEAGESRQEAQRTALARVAGAATNNNAFHMTAPAREGDGSRRAMAAALLDAGSAPDDVEHICAHGTGTVANDKTEAEAFMALFGARLPGITVAAHKSQLGHMMGGAGLAEALVTVKAMQQGVVPPTCNHEQPDPACLGVDCVPGQARTKSIACAITNSAGIGGNNASVVLRRPTG